MPGSDKTPAAQLQRRAETLCHGAACIFGSLQTPPRQRIDRGYAYLQDLQTCFDELESSSAGLARAPQVKALFIAEVRPECYNRLGRLRQCFAASRMMGRSNWSEGKQVRCLWPSPVYCVRLHNLCQGLRMALDAHYVDET